MLIGVAGGGTDLWVCPGGDNAFNGQIAVRHIQTEDKRSLAIEVTNLSLPDSTRLIWVIGGFDAPPRPRTSSLNTAPTTCSAWKETKWPYTTER